MLPPGTTYEEQKAAYAPFDAIVDPDPAMRADVLRLAQAARDRGIELFVIVNNKVEGSSPWTVRALAERIAEGLG
jgi:MinD superfamily P-loop ATPase